MIFSNLTFLDCPNLTFLDLDLRLHAVLQISQIGYFSMIKDSCTDFNAVYTVLKLEKRLVIFWNRRML